MLSASRLLLRPAALSCLALGALHAQPSLDKPANTTSDPRLERSDVQTVIRLAHAANVPPEFAADVLITLVESGLIPDHRTQRNLLEEAFTLAGNAQEKIALKRGGGDSPVTGALHGAFRNGIDQASLRSRVVHTMLRIDSSVAHDLFQRIDLPIPSTSASNPARQGGDCENQTVPDLTLYYVTMWEVARSIPDRAQLEAFFAAHMPRFASAAQITPLARVFMQIPGIERMPAVIDAFASRLPDLIDDSRVFSSYFDESIEAVGQLVSSAAPSTRERLIQQSRAWVIRGVNHGICAEPPKYSVSFDGVGRKLIPFVDPADRFNQEVAWRSRAPDARINDPAVAKREPAASAPVSNSSQYIEHFQTHLLLSRDDEGALDPARWRTEVERYITRLSEWGWPDARIVSRIVSYRDIDDGNEARQDEARTAGDPLNAARQDGALYTLRQDGARSAGDPLNEARQDGALHTPQLEGAVTPSLGESDRAFLEQATLPATAVGHAILPATAVGQAILPAAAFQAASASTPSANTGTPQTNPADFYLEKSDLLTHVLFIERHAPAQRTSGPVKINWYGAPKPEGPRLEIPGRDRVMTALVDLFNGEAARRVYEERRLLWFSPVRDLLGSYERSGNTFAIADLYAASHHPVLSLYGRLAKLIALK
jgi:hypothetical protein